ncbi:MAG: hypothetical protein HC878_20700 [Leptolyngbyaceae cyanobacterium SL_5_14]|nr:hypothetical protein [Leptolyngbyaceae cyanobacterium SL_5_14]
MSATFARDGENAVTFKLADLEQRAWSLEECQVMLMEANEGEQQLASKPGVQDKLRTALGLNTKPSEQPAQSTELSNKKLGKKARSVGKPAPTRRPIGVDQNGG